MLNVKTKRQITCLSDDGVIGKCKGCSGRVCCGIIREGGVIEPPFLTKYDIEIIECFTGLRKKQFVAERGNPITGNTVYLLKTKENKGCIFFNDDDGKCRIHSFRPMDCRLFPLDIDMRGNNFYWALFKYKECNIEEDDILSLLKFKDNALQILGDELLDYASYPVPGMQKIGYEILLKL